MNAPGISQRKLQKNTANNTRSGEIAGGAGQQRLEITRLRDRCSRARTAMVTPSN